MSEQQHAECRSKDRVLVLACCGDLVEEASSAAELARSRDNRHMEGDRGGTLLVRDTAPEGYDWTYLLADEARAVYVGLLQRALPHAECNDFFARILNDTQWQQPEKPSGHLLPWKTAWVVSSGCQCSDRCGRITVPAASCPT